MYLNLSESKNHIEFADIEKDFYCRRKPSTDGHGPSEKKRKIDEAEEVTLTVTVLTALAHHSKHSVV